MPCKIKALALLEGTQSAKAMHAYVLHSEHVQSSSNTLIILCWCTGF